MDQDKTEQTPRTLASDEIAKAKFEAQLKAHREKTARLRAERLARMEASWVERRKETIANIKSGLVELQIKTVLIKAHAFAKPTNSSKKQSFIVVRCRFRRCPGIPR